MRLRRIELAGFGRLCGFRAELAPGLNLFFGYNEAGKSTLQQAVCALLYGFYDGDRARPEETARHERFRPWLGGAPFRGCLEYELEDGRRFEVRRDFSTADVETQLIDVATGQDVAGRYGQGRHGNVPFARKQLGMSRAVFQSCAFISQGEVMQIAADAPRQIGDAIAALADSSRRDVSAKAALDRLGALLQRIGSDRARTALLPSAREALRVAKAELAALDAARLAVAQRAAELQGAKARLARVQGEALRAQALFLKTRDRSLEGRLREVREAEEAMERARAKMEALKEFRSFPAAARDQVVRLRDRRSDALAAVEDLRTELLSRREEMGEEDRLEYEALRASVGGLSEEALESLRATAYAAAGTAVVGNVFLRALRAVLRALAAVARWVLRRRETAPEGREEGKRAEVSREEALVLLEKHSRYLTLRPAAEAVQGLESRLRTAEAALAGIEAELRGLLTAAGLDEGMDIEQGVAAFLEGCRKRTHYEVAEAEEAEAVRHRRLLLGERSPEELEGLREECGRRLAGLLASHPELTGLEGEGSEDELERRLRQLQEEEHELEVRTARLDQEVRSALGEHRPRAEIEEDVERWQREVERLERSRAAAEMAQEAISEAMVSVYRDFAPGLNAFLSEGFEYITEGRYRRAHVDPSTLRISLLLPETDRVVMDPPVSRGTLTVAYLLMRMGLAQHMSAIGEPVPLVLDDPFVDLDERRLGRMLEFILRTAERTQVLLFTKDAGILRWAELRMAGEDRHLLQFLPEESLLAAAV